LLHLLHGIDEGEVGDIFYMGFERLDIGSETRYLSFNQVFDIMLAFRHVLPQALDVGLKDHNCLFFGYALNITLPISRILIMIYFFPELLFLVETEHFYDEFLLGERQHLNLLRSDQRHGVFVEI